MDVLHTWDWIVLAAYVAAVLVLGSVAHRGQNTAADFFLGGRRLAWPLVGVSILATAFSATSLLGGPGEALGHGLLWVQLQVGDLLAVAVVAWVFIPALRGRDLTTAYEFLEQRFDVRVRMLSSALFQVQVVLRAGILVYGPALALSTLSGLELWQTIVLVGALATAYTALGGMTAVVWTDALQLAVVVIGLGGCLWTVSQGAEGGLTAALARAGADGKLAMVDPGQPLSSVRSWPGAIFGYGLLALAVSGTNQQTVQRYLSCRSVAEARRAAWTGWAVGAAVTLLTLGVGVALYGYYHLREGGLPTGIAADAILPHFVATALPPGLAGLLVAAILAAAMSSLDSALSSLATATEVDLFGRGRGGDALRRARRWTLVWGFVATAAALALAGRGTLLALGVKVMGWFAGPMLAVFLLALWSRGPSAAATLVGALCGWAGVMALTVDHPWRPELNLGIWTTAFGTVLSLTIALLVGFLHGGRGRRRSGEPDRAL